MDENLAWCVFIGILAGAYLIRELIDAIAEVKVAKYQSFSPTKEFSAVVDELQAVHDYDGPVYDLHNFIAWLEEKGALREGFGKDKLVEDYILTDE